MCFNRKTNYLPNPNVCYRMSQKFCPISTVYWLFKMTSGTFCVYKDLGGYTEYTDFPRSCCTVRHILQYGIYTLRKVFNHENHEKPMWTIFSTNSASFTQNKQYTGVLLLERPFSGYDNSRENIYNRKGK